MKNRKGFTIFELFMVIAIIGFLSFMIVGCLDVEQTADEKLAKQTESSMKEANSQIGMPAIKNFQERKLAKMIFELRDQENLITYAYIVNKMEGRLVFIGKCIGFGLPYSVQYTNPMTLKKFSTGSTLRREMAPQQDPNGLFMPDGLSATWLMMIDPKTKEPRPVYVEPEIVVSPFPLHAMGAE